MQALVTHVLGARPNFMKAAPVTRALGELGVEQMLIHTGQHYDARMSDVFFADLGLPEPDVNLHVGSGPHGEQTAAVIGGVERELMNAAPRCSSCTGTSTPRSGPRSQRPSCMCRSRT
jgi:UDP-N-acetylglucosamine 2-epimerase (non-hydrolysing)